MKKIQAIGIVLIVDPHNHTHPHIIKKVFMRKEKRKTIRVCLVHVFKN